MAEIHGSYDPRFSQMADLLSASLDAGTDIGASVAVTLDGERVVDIWAGWVDEAKTMPWQADTIINVWSSTKTVTALAALVLVDRGELDVFKPVAHYWPEFAANGKGAIEVRHLLSHTSGIAGWDQPVELADLFDWEKSTAMLAAQAPWWEPGTASGYHGKTYGHLIGEVIRRITGQKLGEFLASEVAGPLGADFHIGLDPTQFHRVANGILPTPPPTPDNPVPPDPNSISYKSHTGPAWQPPDSWTAEWRQADIGAANGHGNARSLARLQSVVACGGEVDGVRLLSPPTCDLIFQEQSNGVDLVLGVPLRFGIGYALPPNTTFPFLEGRVAFWGGWGGSVILVDCDRRMTISYAMNLMKNLEGETEGDMRGPNLVQAAYAALRL